MRDNVLHGDAHTGSTQYEDDPLRPSTARDLQEVLSLRLPSFYRCALQLLGNPADAEDAVQDAILAAHKHMDQFKGQSQIATWLDAIVRNCALMQLRRRLRQIHVALDEHMGEEDPYCVWEKLADNRPSPEDQCCSSELATRLRKCTARLSPALRTTFELRMLEDLSIFETAQMLGLPEGTVKARLARARRKLAQYMKPVLDAI
jgi:RNA polymerase sigma-70 factor, ECF subfamily